MDPKLAGQARRISDLEKSLVALSHRVDLSEKDRTHFENRIEDRFKAISTDIKAVSAAMAAINSRIGKLAWSIVSAAVLGLVGFAMSGGFTQ